MARHGSTASTTESTEELETIADGEAPLTDTADENGDGAFDDFESELATTISDALNDDEDDEPKEDDDEIALEGELEPEEDDEGAAAEDAARAEVAGESAAPAAAAGEQPRDADGKFIKAEDAPAAGAAGAAAEKPADGAAASKWEPLTISAEKEMVPIEEAQITRSGGNVFIAVPEDKFERFKARVSRGITGERRWRQLDQGFRELEARKNAPPRKSDAEIESEIFLARTKQFLPELFDEKDIKLMQLEVKEAQRAEKDRYETAESARLAEASAPSWEEQQATGLGRTVRDIVDSYPELKELSPMDIGEVLRDELLPVRNALVFREGDQMYANTEFIHARLKARVAQNAAQKGGATAAATQPATGNAGAAASAPARTPSGNAGHSGHTATTTPAASKTAQADRFNRGVDAAAKPRTTSVKANRETTRPATGATRGTASAKRRPTRDQRARAEDNWRKTERAYLSSNSMDFDDPAEGDEE